MSHYIVYYIADLFQPLRDGINQIRRREKPDLFVYKDVTLGVPKLYKPTGKMLTYAALKVGLQMIFADTTL